MKSKHAMEETIKIREAIKAYVKDVINPTNPKSVEAYLDREYPLVKYPALYQLIEPETDGSHLAVMFTSETSGYAVGKTRDWAGGGMYKAWISHYDDSKWVPAKIVAK